MFCGIACFATEDEYDLFMTATDEWDERYGQEHQGRVFAKDTSPDDALSMATKAIRNFGFFAVLVGWEDGWKMLIDADGKAHVYDSDD